LIDGSMEIMLVFLYVVTSGCKENEYT
jgi:hypothetical protein